MRLPNHTPTFDDAELIKLCTHIIELQEKLTALQTIRQTPESASATQPEMNSILNKQLHCARAYFRHPT